MICLTDSIISFLAFAYIEGCGIVVVELQQECLSVDAKCQSLTLATLSTRGFYGINDIFQSVFNVLRFGVMECLKEDEIN